MYPGYISLVRRNRRGRFEFGSLMIVKAGRSLDKAER